MCAELEVTLQGQPRTSAEREELLNKWDELSNYQIGLEIQWGIQKFFLSSTKCIFIDLSNYRPVYAPKDLLEVLLSLKGPMRQEDE